MNPYLAGHFPGNPQYIPQQLPMPFRPQIAPYPNTLPNFQQYQPHMFPNPTPQSTFAQGNSLHRMPFMPPQIAHPKLEPNVNNLQGFPPSNYSCQSAGLNYQNNSFVRPHSAAFNVFPSFSNHLMEAHKMNYLEANNTPKANPASYALPASYPSIPAVPSNPFNFSKNQFSIENLNNNYLQSTPSHVQIDQVSRKRSFAEVSSSENPAELQTSTYSAEPEAKSHCYESEYAPGSVCSTASVQSFHEETSNVQQPLEIAIPEVAVQNFSQIEESSEVNCENSNSSRLLMPQLPISHQSAENSVNKAAQAGYGLQTWEPIRTPLTAINNFAGYNLFNANSLNYTQGIANNANQFQ